MCYSSAIRRLLISLASCPVWLWCPRFRHRAPILPLFARVAPTWQRNPWRREPRACIFRLRLAPVRRLHRDFLYRRIWTPPVCNSRLDQDRWSQLLTYIRLRDAAGQRLCREPRWVFARFHLKAPMTLANAMPVHTSGSGSDGVTVSPSLAICCNCRGGTSFPCSRLGLRLASPTVRARKQCLQRA